MSIQDDYFDIQHILKKHPSYKKTFEHFARWAFDLEEMNNQLNKKVQDLETTVRIITEIRGKK